jgi:phosphoserine phosphatase
MKNVIFVDLDETLIHTFMQYDGENVTGDAVPVKVPGDKIPYQTSLRKGSKEFLQRLRELGDVRMLTAATTDYANAMNRKFGFGFTSSQIYAREDIAAGAFAPNFFGECKVYLYDNLPRHENRSKIVFLRPLGNVEYVQVSGYYGNNDIASLTPETIDYLIGRIK